MQLLFIKEDRNVHVKGDCIEVRASSTPFGGSEPDVFVMIEISEPMTSFLHYMNAWEKIIDYEIVNSDPVLDGFRLRAFSTMLDSLNNGALTRENVESFINNWGGTVHSTAQNEVVFDITIFDAFKSNAFWEIDTTGVIFTEIGYNQTTGVHTVEINYNAIDNNPTYIEKYLLNKGMAILSHYNKVATIEMDRLLVRAIFEDDIKEKAKQIVKRRRYYINPSVVDFIVGQGDTLTTDLTTLNSYLRDKVTD